MTTPARRFDAYGVLFALVIVLLFGLVEALGRWHETRLRAEKAEAALLACLNGGAPGLYTTDPRGIRHWLVCGKTWEVSDENVKERKS